MAKVVVSVVGKASQDVEMVSTVADVKRKVGLGTGYQASVNRSPADDSDLVEDGDHVSFAKETKGGI